MAVAVTEIQGRDLPEIGQFLNLHLNSRVSAQEWAAAVRVPWSTDAPNHGFALRDGEQVVGAYLAIYSTRTVDGRSVPVCNLAAWCVSERFRFHSVKLVKALLAQEGYTFTDLSPSPGVVPLNRRLGFTELDTTTALLPCLPWPTRPGRISVTTDLAAIENVLTDHERAILRDHRGTAAARHLLLRRGTEHCYVILRHDRRKNLPLFASVLYVGNPTLFHTARRRLARHLLLRHRVLALLAEVRVVGRRPAGSVMLGHARPKMFRSAVLTEDQVDYLYSELACVNW